MKIGNTVTASVMAVLVAGLTLPSLPGKGNAQEVTERGDVELIIREYLLEHPEILIEMQDVLQKRQQEQVAENQKRTLADNHEAIYSSPHQIEIGNPDAKITVVEFFDYNCGFCARALDDMNRILETNNDVRFVLKEFPILGPASVEAHQVSMAFAKLKPEQYGQYHIDLLSMPGRKDGARATELAVSMGADEAELKAEMEKPYIVEALDEVQAIASGLGIGGTPSYVIGDEVVFGAVGFDELMQRVAQLSGE